jgi:hypothetical protein
MFPFGYEALTLICTYNYAVPVPFFLANLLLLARNQESGWPISLLFVISSALALLTALGHEAFFFQTIFSGLFALIEPRISTVRVRRPLTEKGFLALAPLLGCAIWVALYYAFLGRDIPKQITNMHLLSILSVYYRQYSLLDVFVPWLSSVTRHFVFFGWSTITIAAVTISFVLFLSGLVRLSMYAENATGFRQATSYKLLAIIVLLLGASSIYALGGGFSLDSRKKYPLIPLLLLLGCWIFRNMLRKRQVAAPAFLASSVAMGTVAAMTTWLVVGIWKYETTRFNALAEFIAKQKLHGDVGVRWNPDLYRAWPEMERSLNFRFDDAWVLNGAVEYQGGKAIGVTASDNATVIEYDPQNAKWQFAKP